VTEPEVTPWSDEEVTSPLVNQVTDPEDTSVNGKLSITDRLRLQHKEQVDQKFKDIDIPGFNGDLFCRYIHIDGKQLDAIGVKVRAEFRNRGERVFASTCDNMILACDEFWVRDDGREIPFREAPGYKGPRDIPVRYDIELAQALGFAEHVSDPPTARSIVLGLFAGNDLAVNAHGARLMNWLMQIGSEMDALLGEV
jgi:hypothetical protein